MQIDLSAKAFSTELESQRSEAELQKYQRFFPNQKETGDTFIGVRMGTIFLLAKEFIDMPLDQIEKLLESEVHEMRVGAVSIMDYQARSKKTSEKQKKALFDLYIRRHDRITTWDLVDRSAIYVVGQYLADKPRDILYTLAKSKDMAERRTAIVSTAYFLMKLKEVEDTLTISELLLSDKEDLIHKATGWMLRTAYGVDKKSVEDFLDKHAAVMPRVMLRYTLEKFDAKQKAYYMSLAKK